MRLLASSKKHILKIFPEILLSDIQDTDYSDAFLSFRWHDAFAHAHEFVIHGQRLSDSAFALGVVEDYSASSQFDRLREWQGPAIWTIAFDGNGFHGQYDRPWLSIRGNLFLCLAMPVNLAIDMKDRIQRLPAEIIVQELKRFAVSDVVTSIKHPNDVVVQLRSGRDAGMVYKIAGSLTELRILGDRITQIRYGIGMNLSSAPIVSVPGHLHACAFTDYYSMDGGSNDGVLPYFFHTFLNGIVSFMNAESECEV